MKYRVKGLGHLTQEYGSGWLLVIENELNKTYAISFPNGPDIFTSPSVLISRMRSGIENLEILLPK